ncbi:hypothetical protein EI77_04295 [Prosthecobacter fusiformis]|uniref:Uncharacterized protein n=1 Tax=Prosthecobacter fusiformis TaxID=48464 RepID=A0A4R7RJ66_9BACT|nr:hypothetical protein [Prosthecobacter fusiformis]TDU64111.1 hypothetical protein EI77_04295 [Prosthecobacter fusiformis]
MRLTLAVTLLVSGHVFSQLPVPGSVGLTIKNAGDGSGMRWLAPMAGKVLGFNSEGQLAVLPGGGVVMWGDIEGTITEQADLQGALEGKLNAGAVSDYGLTLVDDVDATAMRATLGLGTLATQSGELTDYLTVSGAAVGYVSLTGSYDDPGWMTGLAWSKISGVPEVFPPDGHEHEMADVTGLDTALEEKLASSAVSAYGLTLVDDVNAGAARATLGLVIGTDVLAPTGSGASLTGLNASALTSGTVGTARLGSGTASSRVGGSLRLCRGGVPIVQGNTDAARTRAHAMAFPASTGRQDSVIMEMVDTPGTTDEVTYTVELITNSTTSSVVYVNRTGSDTNDSLSHARTVSTLTIIPCTP